MNHSIGYWFKCLSGWLVLLFALYMLLILFHVCIQSPDFVHNAFENSLLNILYSIIAAIIFHIIINIYPSKKREIRAKKRVLTYLNFMDSSIRKCLTKMHPFSFENNKNLLDKESFVKEFDDLFLDEIPIYKQVLTTEKLRIERYCDCLLIFKEKLTDEIIYEIIEIKYSDFIMHDIICNDKIEMSDKSYEIRKGNQSEIGTSIYDIYLLIQNIKKNYD